MASDYYPYNKNDEKKSYQRTVALCIAAASLVVLIFLVVLYVNSDKKNKNSAKTTQEVESAETEEDFLAGSHNFTSDELSFWQDEQDDEEAEEEPEGELTPYDDGGSEEPANDVNKKPGSKEGDDMTAKAGEENEDENEGSLVKDATRDSEGDDDRHIGVTDENGNTRYYEILEDVEKNNYDFDNCLINRNGRLSYKDNNVTSSSGVDLSKFNGNIDFKKVSDDGIDYCMLRLGSRGSENGELMLDDKFVEYAQNAAINGLDIGTYFYSQAISEAEAVEEANYIVGAIGAFNVKMPIAIDLEESDGKSRTADLTSKERTAIAKSFCDTVRGFGYKPVIYAQRDMLITGLDLEELKDYDIWLADTNTPTDFPYEFTMWQYSQKGSVDGINGDVDLNMCFKDYIVQ